MLALTTTLSLAGLVATIYANNSPLQQSYVHELNLPARRQWGAEDPGVSGFCGSASLQTAALKFGNWYSQEMIRRTSGGVGSSNQLLLGDPNCASCAMKHAARALLLDTESWGYDREL